MMEERKEAKRLRGTAARDGEMTGRKKETRRDREREELRKRWMGGVERQEEKE